MAAIQPRDKTVRVTNPAPGKKEGKAKKRKARAKNAEEVKPKRRRHGRKKNPSIDFKGHGLGFLGGAVAGVLAGPSGMLGEKLGGKHETAKRIARIAVATAVPAGAGVVVSLAQKDIGLGMTGGAGAVLAERTMNELAQSSPALAKAGFLLTTLAGNYTEKAGVLFRVNPDGTQSPMLPVTPKGKAEIKKADGTIVHGTLLGADTAPNEAVVLSPDGTLHVLSDLVPADGSGQEPQPQPQAQPQLPERASSGVSDIIDTRQVADLVPLSGPNYMGSQVWGSAG